MSKETEELVFIGIVAIVVLKLLMNGSGTSALALAKINAQTNQAYADDAASVAESVFGAFS